MRARWYYFTNLKQIVAALTGGNLLSLARFSSVIALETATIAEAVKVLALVEPNPLSDQLDATSDHLGLET